ncbi:glycosyltransferase [Halieaceae bacterium IMCC8485]|uniref:Glycosyltransferase n=1 Tax=Candidatus Seongchinamella marina TaxID=2518990 RepID=A0ABT3SYZ3_9GAMM|nr:glycosyltransferase [Candidatus Seongchinamella marina]MCX2975094.1 glycosyltransferase [Candidatus Seongchinamella marina]
MSSEKSSVVAIITRTKNRNALLTRAVNSVLGQTYLNWEHVIVNDGGDRESVESLLAPYAKRYAGRLKLIHHDVSTGMEAASNTGVNHSESEFIAIHDDDDSWDKDFLQICIEQLLTDPDTDVKGVVTGTIQVFESIRGANVVTVRRQEYNPELTAISLPSVLEVNQFLPIAFLFYRSAYEEIGPYDETLPVIGDWEFNIRFLSKFDIRVIRDSLAFYHVRLGAEGDWANSVSRESLHAHYRAKIVNRYVRKDLERGAHVMGAYIAMGDFLFRTNRNLSRFGRILDKLKQLPFVSFLRKKTGI